MAKRIKKITKASKRRLVLFGALSSFIIVYFFISISLYAIKIYNLNVEKDNLKNSLTALKSNEKNLKTEIEKLQNKEYLAKYARENYQYSKDGELVIQMDNQEEIIKQKEKININTQYILYTGGCILVLVFIYILKKKK